MNKTIPSETGPSIVGAIHQGGLSRLRRIERQLNAMKIIAGGDVEPGEQTDAGMTLRFANPEERKSGGDSGAEEDAASQIVAMLQIREVHPDSPASGVLMYRGDVYGNGTMFSPTKRNVTIRIPGIGQNVRLPAIGSWELVPKCAGLKTIGHWTGLTKEHVDEVIYEALGIVLIV